MIFLRYIIELGDKVFSDSLIQILISIVNYLRNTLRMFKHHFYKIFFRFVIHITMC